MVLSHSVWFARCRRELDLQEVGETRTPPSVSLILNCLWIHGMCLPVSEHGTVSCALSSSLKTRFRKSPRASFITSPVAIPVNEFDVAKSLKFLAHFRFPGHRLSRSVRTSRNFTSKIIFFIRKVLQVDQAPKSNFSALVSVFFCFPT